MPFKCCSPPLLKVGLGNTKYGAPLIGELVEWPRAEMPQEIWPDCGMEFIPYMGQSFDAVKYPLLAQLHPTNILPADMRGYSPRGWDNARGIDTGRVLMSAQEDAMQNITGTTNDIYNSSGTGTVSGAFSYENSADSVLSSGSASGVRRGKYTFNASLVARTAAENRGKNIAWNMIVRAK